MGKALIVYGTTEGHTAKVANHIADQGRKAGHEVDVVHGAELPEDLDLDRYDTVLVGASLHEGRHQRYIQRFVKEHRDLLEKKRATFFQVSLASAIRDEEHERHAREAVDDFIGATGWKPAKVEYFGGALLYTKYNWMKRALMKMISKQEGRDTDTSRDYEYTDWNRVDGFAEEVFGSLAA